MTSVDYSQNIHNILSELLAVVIKKNNNEIEYNYDNCINDIIGKYKYIDNNGNNKTKYYHIQLSYWNDSDMLSKIKQNLIYVYEGIYNTDVSTFKKNGIIVNDNVKHLIDTNNIYIHISNSMKSIYKSVYENL